MTSQNQPTAAHPERQYLDILRELLETGTRKGDRTGTGTRSVFGRSMRFDLSDGFPLLTTKRVHVRSVVHELLWFLSGDTNVRYLRENGVSIWDEWADENGDLGPVYGKQWRSWATPDGGTIDQVSRVVDEIRRNPDSRRLVVSAWNPADLDRMALAPCHCLFQFNTRPMTKAERLSSVGATEEEVDDADMSLGINRIPDRFLDLQLYQRSADVFLGVPFNVASYALLLALVARHCNCHPGDFVHTFGDLHLYENHLDAARTQLAREPGSLPRLTLAPGATDLFSFRYEDIAFEGYDPQPAIKAPVAV